MTRILLGISSVVGMFYSISFVDETPGMTVLLGGVSAVILGTLVIEGLKAWLKWHPTWGKGRV